jgi:hypothetical protein
MKKVININFQGRVVPIEEPAYENLKKYVESLRNYFSNEEGKEEIINDIENRIAELFNERIKAGATFITEEHVETIVSSMGRPEQFDEISMNEESNSGTQKIFTEREKSRGSIYRNANEKLIGGVCSGMGSYFRIDTSIIRVLFVLLAFGSFGFMFFLYILLWAILPSKYLSETIVRRKLYRDADNKVIGGVLSGIAQYFDIQVWIPRLIFLLPILFGILRNTFPFGFPFFYGFSGSFFLTYIILWAVIPKAVTASEKMEMKGEKVDLESIKNKIQDELQGVKKNIDDNKEKWKDDFKTHSSSFTKEVKETARPVGRGFFRFIAALFKVFIFFILGIIALVLFAVGTGAVVVGTSLMPLNYFIANSGKIQFYAWGTIFLFIILPIAAVLVYLFRKVTGVKSRSTWLGWTFGGLWAVGWVAVVMLFATISNEFRRSGQLKQQLSIQQPVSGKMKLMFNDPNGQFYPIEFDFYEDNDDDLKGIEGLKLSKHEDSLLLTNMRVRLEKSNDDNFHLFLVKRAKASTTADAESHASKIDFPVEQVDSILNLPLGFVVDDKMKFRNQQVIVLLEVPVGKEVYIDRRANKLNWFNIRGGTRGLNISVDDDWDYDSWRPGAWYKMTESGIERMGGVDEQDGEIDSDELENRIDRLREEIREEEIHLKSIDRKIKGKDSTGDVQIKSNASNTKQSKFETEAEAPSPSGNFQILFRALSLLKLAR